MVSRVLRRKLRRDLRRQWPQFAAVAVVVAIAVAVYVAASDAYSNLGDSFDRAYAEQRLPDVVLIGPAAPALATEAAALPGEPAVNVRRQVEVGAQLDGHKIVARVVGVPERAQPEVSRLAVRVGALPGPGEVLVEQHLADHLGLAPGDTIELLGADGPRQVAVSGTGLSTEYFWPARSQQELMTTADQFGVLFGGDDLLDAVGAPVETQLALYARDRGRASELVEQASALGATQAMTVVTREEQPSFQSLDQDVQTFGEFANLLPVAFLVAGVLGAYILLSRLVHAQRAVIGTLAANGVAPSALRRHYLGYGLAAGGLAVVPGLVVGYLIGGWFTTMYTDALGLPLHVTSLHLSSLVTAATAGLAATTLAAWGPARAASRTAPGEAMRISPPGRGRSSVLERLVPPLRRLPARWRMVLRGVGRNRRRALFTVVGVAVSLALVVVFAGLRDTVSGMLDRQFGTIDRSHAQLQAVDSSAVDGLLRAVRADPAVERAEAVTRATASLAAGDRRTDTLLVGLPADASLHRFADRSGAVLALPPHGGVLLGDGLRTTLGARVGDDVVVTLAASGDRLVEPVVGFLDEPMAAIAYVANEHLASVPGAPGPTGVLVRFAPGADRDAAGARLAALPGAAAYADNAATEAAMRDAFAMLEVLVVVMLAFAAVLAAALLFNAMSANVAERSVEMGTLRAAGLSRATLSRLVAAENLLLTLIGLPIGLVVGTVAARWFMSNYQNLGYQFSLDMQSSTYVLVTAGILLAAVVAQLPIARAVRRLDLARIVRERSL